MSGMSGHERPNKGETDVWLTPQFLIDLLGPFDLDPCAASNAPWPTATKMLTIADDGLAYDWHGLVWLNPPYSDCWTWMRRLADHGNGIALIFARTETKGFHEVVWGRADAIAFPMGRYKFYRADGSLPNASAGAPSCFVAFGDESVGRLARLNAPMVTPSPPTSRRLAGGPS